MENFTTSLEYKKAVVNPTETGWLFRTRLAFPEEVNQVTRKFSSS